MVGNLMTLWQEQAILYNITYLHYIDKLSISNQKKAKADAAEDVMEGALELLADLRKRMTEIEQRRKINSYLMRCLITWFVMLHMKLRRDSKRTS